MSRHPLIAIGLACLVALAGCSAVGLPGDSTENPTDSPSPTDEPADEPTDTSTTDSPTSTTTATASGSPTATPAESWYRPAPPNTPFQNHMNYEDFDRIHSAEIVGGSGSGDTYSSVEIEIQANTSMPDVDPAEKGTVRGEPYFLVYANASYESTPNGTRVVGDLLANTGIVVHKEDGTFTISIPQAAFEQLEIESGEVELTIFLMDEDSEYDDMYERVTLTFTYDPDA